jgi:hypothetical protein
VSLTQYRIKNLSKSWCGWLDREAKEVDNEKLKFGKQSINVITRRTNYGKEHS